MRRKLPKLTAWISLLAAFTLAVSVTQAAPPEGKGKNRDADAPASEEPASETVAPELPYIFLSSLNYVQRFLTVQGQDLVSGDIVTPVFPTIFIGGEAVAFDEAASVATMDFSTNVGALKIPFQAVLDALGSPDPLSGLDVLSGDQNWQIKVVTGTGTALFSAYFPRTIRELPADTGVCPCAAEYAVYNNVDAAPAATFCSAAEGISTDEYIEAGYGKPDGTAVIIGSHRSWSSEGLYASSCYARDLSQVVAGEETPQYLGGSPIPVGDADHLLCVALIESIEAACSP